MMKPLSEVFEEAWPEIAKWFAERNWPDTKFGNAASMLNGRASEILAVLKDAEKAAK